MDTPAGEPQSGFSFDALNNLGISLDQVNWERELKRIGALSGSVIGSYVSSRMALSLGLRLVSVVGGSYSGLIAATVAYEAWRYYCEKAE